MLIPEEFVDEVADVILTNVEENDARDSNISRFKLVVKLDYEIHCLDCKFKYKLAFVVCLWPWSV